MVRIFIDCLSLLGIKKQDIKFGIKVFSDISVDESKKFWSQVLGISKSSISYVNILEGKKKGKLKYGMCRVRIVKGGPYLKLITSMIDLLKSEMIPAAVVQRIGRGFPKP